MAANVESMFYVRETPWHGLGIKVQEAPTSKDALILAGLDWHVVQEPVYTGQNELVQGYKANVRDSDRKVLGVVTDRYKIVQNTPLGQAFLIPYNNKGKMECQFQLGYKGLIDLSYRNPNMQIITAHTVYENDEFEYELGLNPCLNHRPTLGDRGEIRLFYGLFKLTNGGFGFEVMSKTAMDDFAKEYSKAFDSSFSPWRTNYESMALKTIIKKALKYAPLKSEFRNALSTDETIKNEIGADMSEINSENIFDTVYQEECA